MAPPFNGSAQQETTSAERERHVSQHKHPPEWLAVLGIANGQWFCDSKARWQRVSTSMGFSPEARIYAYLVLHSAGYQSERAVTMVAGRRIVPVTPSQI